MTVLIFNHDGEEIVTAAWTAAAERGDDVTVCYQWGANGYSFFSNAVGIRRVEIPITMARLVKMLRAESVVDLRSIT